MGDDYEKSYHSYNGTKLEYASTESGSYTAIKGLVSIPDIGGEPNEITTTTLENTEYETSMLGLKPVQKYNFEFNMEDPSTVSNIKVVSSLEDSNTAYFWKLTLSNGVIVSFKSKVRTTIKGGSTGDLIGFTLHLAPMKEPARTIPTPAS